MALTKEEKDKIVEQVTDLFSSSKLTVVAKYTGTSVKEMQQLRHDARETNTKVQVVKNRLVIKALEANDKLKQVDVSNLTGQLVYAFNADDEAAPAQTLNTFAKLHPSIEFAGAITADGSFMSAEDVKTLANLPTKDQLRGQLVGTLAAPLTGFIGVLSADLRSVLYALNSRAGQLGAQA
jgi:large subunit ribosomal protein L10